MNLLIVNLMVAMVKKITVNKASTQEAGIITMINIKTPNTSKSVRSLFFTVSMLPYAIDRTA